MLSGFTVEFYKMDYRYLLTISQLTDIAGIEKVVWMDIMKHFSQH